MERIDSSKLGFRWCLLDFDEPVFSGNLGVHMVRELYIHTHLDRYVAALAWLRPRYGVKFLPVVVVALLGGGSRGLDCVGRFDLKLAQ